MKLVTIFPMGIVPFDLLIATVSPMNNMMENNYEGPKTNLYSLPGQMLKKTQLQIHTKKVSCTGKFKRISHLRSKYHL